MDAQKLQLKIFVARDSAGAPAETIIPVFHTWIREHAIPELLVDVTNYAHVPEGPGVVVIGHATDYFYDEGGGRAGLLCNRKRQSPPPAERLGDLARRTFYAASLLERDPAFAGKLRFATGELLFRINDRLAASNDDATFAAVKPELEGLARRLYESPFDLTRVGGPKDLFAVRITSPNAVPLATLLERAGGAPAAI
ncbi:MAG TPA: hypothetical protein VK841_20960 [Polyangiaceae bacterium]|nr:hypothetical protein [Polyangiaceae bacterium]